MRRSVLGQALGGATVVGVGVAAGLAYAGRVAGRRLNPVVGGPLPPVPDEARRVHERLSVADLHADSLLWPRDLLRHHAHGHADLPRLLAGGVGLQVFSVVTSAPVSRDLTRGVPSEHRDVVALLSVASARPPRTWRSRLGRALEQADRLHDAAERSGGLLRVVRSAEDIRDDGHVAGLLAVEGLHALDGDAANLEVLFGTGFRMFGLVHLADNEVAGSSTGTHGYGLTALGREVVGRIERLGGLVDLAHASPATIDEVLALTTRPVLVSHTGVRATVPHPRNLSDDHIQGVAATGGVIGVGLWPEAVGAADPAATVRAIRHVADLVGVEHVALGSDFDGTVATPFDASGWVRLTAALLAGGFSQDDVERVMGGNVRRLFARTLPRATA
jgi:membrane dipeptidase